MAVDERVKSGEKRIPETVLETLEELERYGLVTVLKDAVKGISPEKTAVKTGFAEKTVSNKRGELVERSILKKKGRKSGTTYFLTEKSSEILGVRRLSELQQETGDLPDTRGEDLEISETVKQDEYSEPELHLLDPRNTDNQVVEKLLERNGGVMKRKELGEKLGWSVGKIRDTLSDLEEAGEVSRLGIGGEKAVRLEPEFDQLEEKNSILAGIAAYFLEEDNPYPKSREIEGYLADRDIETSRKQVGTLMPKLAGLVDADYEEEFCWGDSNAMRWNSPEIRKYQDELAKIAAGAELETRESSEGEETVEPAKDTGIWESVRGLEVSLEDEAREETRSVPVEEISDDNTELELEGLYIETEENRLAVSRFVGNQDGLRLLKDTDGNQAIRDEEFPEADYVLVDLDTQVDGFGGMPCYRPVSYFDNQEDMEKELKRLF